MKKVALGVVVLLLVLVAVIALQPSEYHVERSATVAAPPAVAFALVNDFHAWPAWNPFAKTDPSQKEEYAGARSGVGASCTWKGEKTGEGRMTIEKSEPGKSVGIKLEFFKPYEGTNHAVFTFVPEGAGTKVTWAMDGSNSFIGKAFALVMNMQKMMVTKFDEGLADLGKAAAAEAKKTAAPPVVPQPAPAAP
jgi:carbon monoxide dehydrogenase subunit G